MGDSHDCEVIRIDVPGLHYFRKKMNTRTENKYYSHVFYTEPLSEERLRREWMDITSYIAVRFQSEEETLIERSNYYLFFYTIEKVDHTLRDEIEGDDFCARKYVMEERYYGQDGAVCDINDKLFAFSGGTGIAAADQAVHVNQLAICNFRGYEGKRYFRFMSEINGRNEETASFVLVYAKNGVGKTSIFDAVEYLLKGTVDRLDTLEKNNKKSGSPALTLHNLKHPHDESYISATLSDEKVLVRAVAKNERSIPPRRGADFINGSNSNWKEIILPHDRIEGFITANKPEEYYDEWIKNSDLQEASDAFLEKNREIKETEKTLGELDDQFGKLWEKFKELGVSRSHVEEIIRLIEHFDELKKTNMFPEGDDLILSADGGIDSYIALVNAARANRRLVETVLKDSVVPEKTRLSDIVTHGRDYYEDRHLAYHNIEVRIQELQKQAEDRKKYDQVITALSSLSKEKSECEAEIKNVLDVLEQGGETFIRDMDAEIVERIRLDAELQSDYEKKTQELQCLKQQCSRINGLLEADNQLLNDVNRYNSARESAEQYVTYRELLAALQSNVSNLDSELGGLNDYVRHHQKNERELEMIVFPEKLYDLEMQTILECGELIGRDFLSDLVDLANEYAGIKAVIVSLEQQIRINANNEDELGKIIALAGSYVASHPDLCDCPVCGKHFRTNKKLYMAIENANTKQSELLTKSLMDSRDAAEELEKRYQGEVSVVRKELLMRKRQYDEEIRDAFKSISLKQKEKEDLTRKCGETNTRLEQLRVSLRQYDGFEENPVDAVENWYSIRRNQQKFRETQAREAAELYQASESEIKRIGEMQKMAREELQGMMSNDRLQRSIRYVSSKEHDWSAEKSLAELQDRLSAIEEKKDGYHDEIRKLDNVKESDIDFFVRQIKVSREEAEALLADESIYRKYGSNWFLLQEEIDALSKREEVLRKEVDILERILEEEDARHYFDEYRETEKKMDALEKTIQAERIKLKNVREETNRLREQLEDDLKKHFNQTVMSTIYSKLDPHRLMKQVQYTIDFSKDGKPLLYISVSDGANEIRPEWYFSTAQLNTLVFSSFFSRALDSALPLKTIFIDDPIAHFDDMNILGFADLMRCLIMETPFQFIMSTHDRKIFNIMKRKLPSEYYRTQFIEL